MIYRTYVKRRKRLGNRQLQLPSAITLGLVGNCHCEPIGVTQRRQRIEITGEIRDDNHELVFQTDALFECCLDNSLQWPLSYFWLAARLRYREVPLEIRLEKKFQLAARRLLKKLSLTVPFPDPAEYFDALKNMGGRIKPYCALDAKRQARQRARERKKEIEQQVDHFITRARQNAREQVLPACFRTLHFDRMPTLIELKEHWKKLAIKNHPDLNGRSSARFKKLRVAFEEALGFFE